MGWLEEQLDTIVEDHDYEAWRQVPDRVVALYKKAAPAACRLAAWSGPAAGPEDQLWWHPDTRTAWAQVDDIEKRADWEDLPDIPGVPDVALFVEPLPPPPVAGWVLVKAADGYLAPLARPGQAVQKMIGGPNGLTEAIVNGLIGGGLGYGAGWLADKFLPEDFNYKGRLANTMGLIGAGAGVAPGLWAYSAQLRHQNKNMLPSDTGKPAYPGYPLPHHKFTPAERNYWPIPEEFDKLPPSPQTAPTPPARSDIGSMPTEVASAHPWLTKAAEGYTSGIEFMPTIPVDAFNRAIWNDVRYPPNRFGTKSQWGDNSQPMGTPPYAAAATSGLLAGASEASQSGVVSPWQVATAAAMGAGKGWLTGLAAGKVLGVLAGMKPEAQARLQETGLWGGLITGVANSLY